MTKKEAWNILGLSDHADKTQIRHAYSEKSKIYHAETHPEEFNRLHEAYKTALAYTGRNAHTFPAQTIFPANPDNTDSIPHAATGPRTAPAAKESHPKTDIPHSDILDELIHGSFSISRCLDITQLIYHRYRYEENGLPKAEDTFGGILTKKGIVWQNPPSDEQLFFGIPWSVWKTQKWTALICHPEFIRRQHTSAFLDELCYFLQEEELCHPDGIGQNFYYALCIAYGFFCDEADSGDRCLQEIESSLRSHPKYREYVFDLYNRPPLQEAREITRFCQKALSLTAEKDMWDFLNTAEEKMLSKDAPMELFTLRDRNRKEYESASSWKQFILRNLMGSSDDMFARQFDRFCELREVQKKYADAFIEMVLSYAEICDITLSSGEYQPLSSLLSQFRQQYLNRDDWRKFICCPVFLQTIKAYVLSQDSALSTDKGNGYPSIRFVPYEAWRQLRTWFHGTSSFLAEATIWLRSGYYFSEYEKRYQKERFWKATRVKEIFLEEILPIPKPDREKRKLLRIVRKGIPADAAQMQSAFLRPILTNEKLRIPFLTRLAYTMVHFRFLQYTPADILPGGIFCFLKKEVILYQQKDNLVCHLSHEVFYDILSRYFDRIVYNWKPSKDARKIYSEEFLDTACRNLYCYECFVHSAYLGQGRPPKNT